MPAMQRANSIRAVVFDFGQVLSHAPSQEDRARMAALLGISVKELIAVYGEHRLPYDRGDISPADYWLVLAERAGVRIGPQVITALRELDVKMWSNINEEIVAWACQLRSQGVKTGILSNMHADLAARFRQWAWPRQFDCSILSCEIRVTKPQSEIYEHCLCGLRVPAAATLFLDDRQNNVQGARSAGMQALQFRSVAELREELSRVNFAVLP
jgi:putative hydrolase of the HAD superfamily